MIADATPSRGNYEILYVPDFAVPHICYMPPLDSVPRGTVVLCRECGQKYFKKQSLLWEGDLWGKVRWWNFKAKKNAGKLRRRLDG